MADGDIGSMIKVVAFFAVVIFIIMIVLGCFVVVPAGNVGVANSWGVVDPNPWQPGMHLKMPFVTNVVMFSTQTQSYQDVGSPGDTDVAQIQALSNEGLTVTMEIAVLYHIDPNMAPDIYKNVGVDYQDVVMKQPIHAVPRDIISRYDAMTLYSASTNSNSGPNQTGRAQIEQLLYDGISKGVLNPDGSSRGIVIENVYLRNVILPDALTSAITSKLTMQQQIQEKEFQVQVQAAEAQRQVEEAKGIADANKIIDGSLSQQYLQWYAIQMMEQHTGATYFIPIGSNGLPIMQPLSTASTPKNEVASSSSTSDISDIGLSMNTDLANMTMATS